MTVVLLFVLVVGFLLIGVPIAVSLGLSSILFLLMFSETSLASIAQSLYQAMAGHYTLLAIPFFILAAAVLLALAMGATLGRAILGRMDTISRAAGEIMAGDLSRRVPASGRNDEFDALADRLNSMLDRIQQLIKGIREVTDNVAHDMRSPLSRLRNRPCTT